MLSDVYSIDGVLVFDIKTTNSDGEKIKALKTASSKRTIPVHKSAIEIGFGQFVENQKEQSSDRDQYLFRDLKPDKTGNRGWSTSKWFNGIRNSVLGKQEHGDKSLHSLRHSMAESVRGTTESDYILDMIGGWKKGCKNSSASYGKPDMKKLKEVVDQIGIEGFDLDKLK